MNFSLFTLSRTELSAHSTCQKFYQLQKGISQVNVKYIQRETSGMYFLGTGRKSESPAKATLLPVKEKKIKY